MTYLISLWASVVLASSPMHSHQLQAQQRLGAATPLASAMPTPASERVTVYGYIPYWISDPLGVDFDSLTHAAWFNVALDASGYAIDTSTWHSHADELVARAHAVGTKVHLTVAMFDDEVQASVLSNATHRARAVSELSELVNAYGADGINVDLEGTAAAQKDDLVQFVIDLKAVVDEVYLATPAVDWRGAYDYDQLAFHSDGMFIMGYGYHWSGGDPGPVAPLFGGEPWSVYALEWTLEDYRTWGATDDKIVMGLPLYGRSWPSPDDSVPGVSIGSSSAVTMGNAIAYAAGFEPRYDDVTETPWLWDGSEQLWYDDHDSVEIKLQWSVDQGIQGVGFWALGYDGNNPAFWEMVDDVTSIGPSDDPGPTDTGLVDTGHVDTGHTDSETTDSGKGDTGAPDADSGSDFEPMDSGDIGETELGTDDASDEEKAGCGCSTAQPTPFWLIALAGLWVRRRP